MCDGDETKMIYYTLFIKLEILNQNLDPHKDWFTQAVSQINKQIDNVFHILENQKGPVGSNEVPKVDDSKKDEL